MKKMKDARYAIACALDDDVTAFQNIFFVKFNTKDEKEALRLSSCVVGVERADKCLVVIGANGEIYEI